MKDMILMTGATGALGSMLLQRLSDQGHEVVCLVRGRTRSDARRRIRELVGERDNVKVIRGDITEPRCGISDIDREHLLGRVRRVLHCAASIDFMNKDDTQATNVAGLMHVLELTDILDAWDVIHVSTAYVVGDADYLPEEGLSLNQRFSNSYEESKYIGETMVRAWAHKRDERRYTILRPSILVGCMDGTTPTLDAFYTYAQPLHRVADSLRARKDKLPSDVSISADGRVTIPLAILVANTYSNYVPIDWVADMMAATIELPPRNKTYHFVHNNPSRTRDLLAWSLDALKIDGVVACATQEEREAVVNAQSPLVRRLQRQIDAVHEAFAPYVTKAPRFEMEAARRELGAKFREPPYVDAKFLHRLLSYARQWHWDVDRKRARAQA